MPSTKVIIFSDGGARGNPGPAAAAFAAEIRNSKHEIRKHTFSKYIGTATNNQAEYQAVIEALTWVKEAFIKSSNQSNLEPGSRFEVEELEDFEIECFLDSQLIVEQLNQRYKLKNEGLKPLFWEIRDLIMAVGGNVTFKHIRREQNMEADRLVNFAIDNYLKGKSIGRGK